MRASGVAASIAICAVAGSAQAATDVTPALYKNCAHLNAKYPHGVGRVGARDHTAGTPVTNFRRSNALYADAMKWNRGLDRDRDGIACEKA